MVVIFGECGMASHAMCIPCSRIGKEIKEEDVHRTWRELSRLVIEKLAIGHGIRIPGFVHFTYKEFRYDTYNNRTILKRIPHIILSKDVVQKNDICDYDRPAYNLDLPEEPINYSQLACRAGLCSKFAAEVAINEVVSAFKRALYYDCHVEFHFPLIGKLTIKCGRLRVCFCQGFIEELCFDKSLIADRIDLPMEYGHDSYFFPYPSFGIH